MTTSVFPLFGKSPTDSPVFAAFHCKLTSAWLRIVKP